MQTVQGHAIEDGYAPVVHYNYTNNHGWRHYEFVPIPVTVTQVLWKSWYVDPEEVWQHDIVMGRVVGYFQRWYENPKDEECRDFSNEEPVQLESSNCSEQNSCSSSLMAYRARAEAWDWADMPVPERIEDSDSWPIEDIPHPTDPDYWRYVMYKNNKKKVIIDDFGKRFSYYSISPSEDAWLQELEDTVN